MIVLGISCFYHDSAAAIIKDGEILAAAQEERFSRKKHDNSFPFKAIEFCLNSLGIAMNEVDIVVFYEKPILKFDRVLNQYINSFPKSAKVFIETVSSWLNEKLQIKKILREKCHYYGRVYFVEHHLSHAAASFLTSPFIRASILTLDGVGEWATTTKGYGEETNIKLDYQIDFPSSLGLLYSALTSYLGFKVNNDEYKVMGLSAYGDPKPYYKKMLELIDIKEDGSYRLNSEYFTFESGERMFTEKLCRLLEGKPREAGSKIGKRHRNIAATLQRILEECVLAISKSLYRSHNCKNLVLSGGVALNSVLNGKILKKTPFEYLYVTPDPGDGGGALGAAFYIYHKISDVKSRQVLPTPYLGPSFYYSQIKEILDNYSLSYQYISNENKFLDKVVDFLIDEKIIAWFQGRMEWGPRALGNRSILASTAKAEMKDIINKRVKHRESFRPFAPVILKEKVNSYFIVDNSLPLSTDYMLLVYPFKEEVKKKVPAVVHVDGTGRLQTINRKSNPLYYDLIKRYYRKTGIPLILNTSFNVRGEPIVCTPVDAVKCFLGTGIDYLVIDRFIVKKEILGSSNEEEEC